MNALLILFLMFGADDLAEVRRMFGPLMPSSASEWSGALKHVDGVWACSVDVNIARRIDEVTESGSTRSWDEAQQLQEVLRPIARKAGQQTGLINPRLGSLDPELEVVVELYPVDEESEDLWSVELRARLLVPARLDKGGLSVRTPVWEMASRGTLPRADLETVLVKEVERSVKAAAGTVKDARSSRPRGSGVTR